jgi:hypothetical protein
MEVRGERVAYLMTTLHAGEVLMVLLLDDDGELQEKAPIFFFFGRDLELGS